MVRRKRYGGHNWRSRDEEHSDNSKINLYAFVEEARENNRKDRKNKYHHRDYAGPLPWINVEKIGDDIKEISLEEKKLRVPNSAGTEMISKTQLRSGLFFYRIELTERTIVDVAMYGSFS